MKFSFLYRTFSDRLIANPGAALIPGLSTEWIRCYHIFLIILLVQVLVKQQTRCEVVLNPSEYLDVEGKAGQPIALPIAAGPATGYAWSLALPEGVERTEDGPASPVDPSARPLNQAARPPPVGAMPLTVFRVGQSYSSNTTPLAFRSATSCSMWSTCQPICVWAPLALPPDWNSRNHESRQRYISPPGVSFGVRPNFSA